MLLLLLAIAAAAFAQDSAPKNDLPQPYRTTRDWGELPSGVKWAAVTAIEQAPDGSIYVIERCFENSCAGRTEPPILKYNKDGKLLARIPVGREPHGLCIYPQPGRYSLGHTGVFR